MLLLSKAKPIGVGGHRNVYVHPDNPTLCVKVLHEPWQEINRRLNDPFRLVRPRWHYDENRSELRELLRLKRRLGPLHGIHFPEPYGLVETDLDEGLVVERVFDNDGQTSLTLKNYLWLYGLDKKCAEALEVFWSFLVKHSVAVRDPMPHNLVVQQNDDERLRIVMIDGFGSSDFLPFRYWVPALAARKLESRRRRMERRIQRELEAKRRGQVPSAEGMAKTR